MGLHLLAKIYEKQGNWKKAYETWYRARERSTLNFYAQRNAHLLEDRFDFKPPQHIIAAVKESRKGGEPNAAHQCRQCRGKSRSCGRAKPPKHRLPRDAGS
jgi:hypothetical protein